MTRIRVRDASTERDREHVANPRAWCHWPLQTMKRYRDGELECGLLLDAPDFPKSSVILENLFSLPKDGTRIADLPRLDYPTFEAMFLDGWMVD